MTGVQTCALPISLVQIYTDSANVQALTNGARPVLKERHVDIKLCKIKDNIKKGRIELHHIPGVD